MQFKFLFGTCVVILVAVMSLVHGLHNNKRGSEWKDPTTLKARVDKEKAKGDRKVVFPAPLMEYPDEISLDTAVAETTILVADVLDKESRLVDPSTIGTFYRLRVIENLSEPSSSPCCIPKDHEFPSDLPALGANEMYFVGIGGTIMIDDVEVTVTEDFEQLQPNRRYLLFLSPTESRRFSVGKIGPRGVFMVAGDGHFDSPLKPLRLGRELESRAGNSLSKLKSEILRLKNSHN